MEAKESEYKKFFIPSKQKLTELRSLGLLKSAHNQVDKILKILSGAKISKEVPIKNPNPISPDKNILDIDLLNEPKPRPNAFDFMKNMEATKPKSNLFDKLTLKTPDPAKESGARVGSSFTFMKKVEEKKDVLEDLDLDFTIANAPANKPSDLLDIDTAFNLLEGPTSVAPPNQGPTTRPVPGIPLQQVQVPPNPLRRTQFTLGQSTLGFLSTSKETEKEEAFDKYFDFVNEDL